MSAPRRQPVGLLLLIAVLALALAAPRAASADDIPDKYRRLFAHRVDSRTLSERTLNSIGMTSGDLGRSFAIVAGVSDYPNMQGASRSLPPAEEDMRKLVAYLRDQESFDEIVLLRNQDMNYDNLRYFLQAYFPERLQNNPRSRFLFAYSGHGIYDRVNGYLLEAGASSMQDRSRAIDLKQVRDFFSLVIRDGHQVLVLINSCYSGAFLQRSFGSPGPLQPKLPGAHAITAGGTNEPTWHDPSLGTGSVFFEKFFAGLGGIADTYPINADGSRGDGIVTVSELATYLKEEITIASDERQNPQLGDISPNGSEGGFFFLSRRPQVARGYMPAWNPATARAFGAAPSPTTAAIGTTNVGRAAAAGSAQTAGPAPAGSATGAGSATPASPPMPVSRAPGTTPAASGTPTSTFVPKDFGANLATNGGLSITSGIRPTIRPDNPAAESQLTRLGWQVKHGVSFTELTIADAPPKDSAALMATIPGPLHVRLNQLDDGISEWRGLSNLTALDLHGENVKELKPLLALTGLTEIGLCRTHVSDLSPLGVLPGLTKIRYESAFYGRVTDLSPLRNLGNLTALRLCCTEVKDLRPLQGLRRLRVLDLKSNEVSDISPLSGLTNLQALDVSDNEGIVDLTPLKPLTGLRMLGIGGLRAPDRELANLSGMTHLTVLELIAYNKNHLRDLSIVRNLPKLTFLNINSTAVSDIAPLEGLSELVTLDLGYAPITNFAPVERLPKLSRLSVAWPRGDLSAIKRRRDVTVSDQNDRSFNAYLEFQQMKQDAAGFSFDCDKAFP